jgi:hypothetical protein
VGSDSGDWAAVLDPTYNEMTGGSVVPSFGRSVSAAATGSGNRMLTTSGSNSTAAAGGSGMVMPSGNFVIGFVVFVVMCAIIMLVAKHVGDEGDFKNIKASAYNVLFVGLVAAVGIPVFKVLFYKMAQMGVPLADHAASWVLAA